MNEDSKVASCKSLQIQPLIKELGYARDVPYDELMLNKSTDKFKRRRNRQMNRPKVFVVSRGVHDYSAAEEFGELRFLSKEVRLTLSMPSVLREFTDTLMRESSSDDLLLVSGLPSLNAFAAVVFYGIHGKVSFLLYNKALGKYHIDRVIIPEFVRQENKLHASSRVIAAQ